MFGVFRRPLTVTRKSGGEYVDGIWQPGSESQITIQASVQPTSPDDMELLPSGRRDRQAFTLYADTPLRISGEVEGSNADTVNIDGAKYEASARRPWQNNIINHHVTVVTKVPDDD